MADRDVYFKFFPSDWRADEQLAGCSIGARGFWVELLCLAFKAGGYVRINGVVPTVDALARQARVTVEEVVALTAELEAAGVCSRDATDQALYCRRMRRDLERRERNKANGRKGGNPLLRPVDLQPALFDAEDPVRGSVAESDNRKPDREAGLTESDNRDVNGSVKLNNYGSGYNSDRAEDLDLGRDPAPLSVRPRATIDALPAPLINGREQRMHQSHAWCSWPVRDGLCIPAFLHSEFLGKSQRTDADLRQWYRATVAKYAGVAIGESALVFWRRELTAWLGTASAAVPGSFGGDKTSRTMSAARELIARQLEAAEGV